MIAVYVYKIFPKTRVNFFYFLFFQDVRFLLYSIGLLISVIFLTATLVTGFLLPSNHHVLHWRCQTYYVACLLVGDLLLAITQIFGNTIVGFTCVSMGKCFFFIYFLHTLRYVSRNNLAIFEVIYTFLSHCCNANIIFQFLNI